MSIITPDRQPAGAPASSGGQFRAGSSPTSTVDLMDPFGPQPVTASDFRDHYGSATKALAAAERGEWDTAMIDPDELEELEYWAELKDAPVKVQITRQRWDGDDLVDIDTVELDATKLFQTLYETDRAVILEGLNESRSGDLADSSIDLYLHAQHAGLVDAHTGSVRASIEDWDEETAQTWFLENPTWVEDGVTPHPLEGYVKFEVHDTRFGRYEQYLDADGKLHRDNAPAVIQESNKGRREATWMQHGRKHRLDGPAVENNYGGQEFWVDDEQVALLKVNSGWDIVDGLPVRNGE